MPSDIEIYARAAKAISGPADWHDLGRHYLSWRSPLEIDGVTVAGLSVRVEAHELQAEQAVRVQLEYQPPSGRSEPLARVEWRPLNAHNNKNKGPQEWRFRPFRQTHLHSFDLNWNAAEAKMYSPNLPIAIPVQDVDSYKEFLDICESELKISKMSIVPLPPWRPRML